MTELTIEIKFLLFRATQKPRAHYYAEKSGTLKMKKKNLKVTKKKGNDLQALLPSFNHNEIIYSL